ncbi:anti-phage-associated DUF1156 domain-containing protein [Caldicellulosiruptoraceae bacterium PP1]
MKSFIEVQFPISKISKESYKERMAGSGQTLTGLGKWWGRKPLILVRAALLGLIMPSSEDPKKDMEIFLKILTMDDDGLLKRKDKPIPADVMYRHSTDREKKIYFIEENGKIKLKKDISITEKQQLQLTVFKRLSYDEKIKYCKRPEEIENTEKNEWNIINNHLGTNAYSLQELMRQLGEKRFGKVPTVGDCFAGGGSIPFEAARMGFDVFASDLNPVAMLLTWASLNILGSSKEEIESLKRFQENVYNKADKIITEWGIEHNEMGHRANAYLYCNETICPECGYKVPLAPSWIIGKNTKTIAILKENENKGYDIEIKSGVTSDEMKKAEKGTIINSKLVCPHCKIETPIAAIRKDRRLDDGTTQYGLRKWEKNEFIPRENDIFQERLYCIRYQDDNGHRYYIAPTQKDLEREEKVIKLLSERFEDWQSKGYIPSSAIEEGEKTNELIRTRGWTYWHQLFNPRQLLLHGLLMELIDNEAKTNNEKILGLIGIGRCTDWNSKLCRWDPTKSGGVGHTAQTYYNQALNTLYNYGTRGLKSIIDTWLIELIQIINNSNRNICLRLGDAYKVSYYCDIWLTDPPYADAVNYHELSEFFLAWDKKMLKDIFPDWYTDSKRALAVKGTGEDFNQTMIDIYKNITQHMTDDGMQIVMFTHQDVKVWSNLALILWASGLRITAAWNIATETDSGGLKDGNYVKGTVLLVLRKQTSEETAFLDELLPQIEIEVKKQIDVMNMLDNKEEPNYHDPDYILASYAAALKVLTNYKKIEDIDIGYELKKINQPGYNSPIIKIIEEAKNIAINYLVPNGFDNKIWRSLKPDERFYLKGIDLEKDKVYQLSSYQEIAKGYGVYNYKDILASTKANAVRVKTALELGMKGIGSNDAFHKSLLRNILVALYLTVRDENTLSGFNWLKNETDFWNKRNIILEILNYLSTLDSFENMKQWEKEAYFAKLLKVYIENYGV